jgi:elongation factor Tu
MNRAPDIEGIFHLLQAEGRETPVCSGYRPVHKLYENYLTSGEHKYLDVAEVAPGSTARVAVWFVTPEVYPCSLWKGREITVSEGGQRIVGTLKVVRVLNPNLRGKASTYNPVWTAPPGLKPL